MKKPTVKQKLRVALWVAVLTTEWHFKNNSLIIILSLLSAILFCLGTLVEYTGLWHIIILAGSMMMSFVAGWLASRAHSYYPRALYETVEKERRGN